MRNYSAPRYGITLFGVATLIVNGCLINKNRKVLKKTHLFLEDRKNLITFASANNKLRHGALVQPG